MDRGESLVACSPAKSPIKRARLESIATQFVASPQSIPKQEAILLKRHDKEHVQLRYISSHAISDDTAQQESPQGFEVCVAPHLAGMFRELRAKEQRLDHLMLFSRLLSTSAEGCAADLTMFPVYILDYHTRRLFVDKKQGVVDPQHYQALFVGKGKRKPFKGVGGDQIRYIYLVRSLVQFGNKKEESDGENGGEETKAIEMERLQYFEDLLCSAEECLVTVVRRCRNLNIDSTKIRAEVQAFYDGEEKATRDNGAHAFTQLFYQQRRTPLEKQHFEDNFLPPENNVIFKGDETVSLMKIGIKILALDHIERSLNAPPSSLFTLTTAAPTLTEAGGQLVRAYIRLKANFAQSMEFLYGSLKASLQVDQMKPVRLVDLQRIGEASGGSLGMN